MSQYCSITDVQSQINPADLIAVLNDGNGSLDQTTLNTMIQHASGQVDAKCQALYQTPFGSPLPAGVAECALIFACYAIYRRVMTPDEKNPFAEENKTWSNWLTAIQKGEMGLDGAISRAFPPAIPFVACLSTAGSTR
jgi:phage gp36-like protein